MRSHDPRTLDFSKFLPGLSWIYHDGKLFAMYSCWIWVEIFWVHTQFIPYWGNFYRKIRDIGFNWWLKYNLFIYTFKELLWLLSWNFMKYSVLPSLILSLITYIIEIYFDSLISNYYYLFLEESGFASIFCV